MVTVHALVARHSVHVRTLPMHLFALIVLHRGIRVGEWEEVEIEPPHFGFVLVLGEGIEEVGRKGGACVIMAVAGGNVYLIGEGYFFERAFGVVPHADCRVAGVVLEGCLLGQAPARRT